jgi:hypothetical protein
VDGRSAVLATCNQEITFDKELFNALSKPPDQAGVEYASYMAEHLYSPAVEG